jgi:hypothetical protein
MQNNFSYFPSEFARAKVQFAKVSPQNIPRPGIVSPVHGGFSCESREKIGKFSAFKNI